MKKSIFVFGILALCVTSCKRYGALQKTPDYEYRYEAAKAYYIEGSYTKAASLMSDVLAVMKGTHHGEESLYLLAQAEYNAGDYETSGNYFKKYCQSYPKGKYVQQARYFHAMSTYKQVPDVRLDQTVTWEAMQAFQSFIDLYHYSGLKAQAQNYINELQDQLVDKEYRSAKLYYDLGTYILNCAYGGNNYEACIITSQNALKDFPFASTAKKEELSMLILRSRYELAKGSTEEKRTARFRDAIDEYYSFINDFPESKYANEANKILKHSQDIVKNKRINLDD